WWHSTANRSPLVTASFLERMRRLLLPATYLREHGNTWTDGADAFVGVEDVDAAMAHGWVVQHTGTPAGSCVAYLDVGLVHDPSVIAVGHREADGVGTWTPSKPSRARSAGQWLSRRSRRRFGISRSGFGRW